MDARKNYEELGMAIVEQAATDYHNARFFLETEDLRSYKDTASKNSRHNMAKKTLAEIESFFHSEWFRTVCPDLDGKKAFEALKETYDREVRDDKMEKFMRNRNNVVYKDGHKIWPIPDACKSCSNHPSNGGSGICNCTLGAPPVKY